MKRQLKFLARGKRSEVFTFRERGKLLVLKREKKEIVAQGRLENEAKFLRLLNKDKIGPRLVRARKKFVVYEFVEGEKIGEYMRRAKKPWPVLKSILEQCFVMDQRGVNKLEMHRPVKHIFVQRGNPVMIDFERCYYTKKPKNVTQFVQFVFALKVVKRGKQVQEALKNYKHRQNERNFKKLLQVMERQV